MKTTNFLLSLLCVFYLITHPVLIYWLIGAAAAFAMLCALGIIRVVKK